MDALFGVQWKDALKRVEEDAISSGLTPSQIHTYISLLPRFKQRAPRQIILIRSLLPSSHVHAKSIIATMGMFPKLALPVKHAMLKWMLQIIPLMDDKAMCFSQLYGVFFHFLDYAKIRPQLCHLLFLITRKEHTKPFRFNKIVGICEKSGGFGEPWLLALRDLYTCYMQQSTTTTTTTTTVLSSLPLKYPFLSLNQKWRRLLLRVNPLVRTSTVQIPLTCIEQRLCLSKEEYELRKRLSHTQEQQEQEGKHKHGKESAKRKSSMTQASTEKTSKRKKTRGIAKRQNSFFQDDIDKLFSDDDDDDGNLYDTSELSSSEESEQEQEEEKDKEKERMIQAKAEKEQQWKAHQQNSLFWQKHRSRATSIPISQLGTVSEVGMAAPFWQLPPKVPQILSNKASLHCLQLEPNEVIRKRVSNWLRFYLDDVAADQGQRVRNHQQVFHTHSNPRTKSKRRQRLEQTENKSMEIQCVLDGNVWKALLQITQHLQDMIPDVERLILRELPHTSPFDANFGLLLELLSFIPPKPYEVLYEKVLSILHGVFFTANAETKTDMINCYKQLFARWSSIDLLDTNTQHFIWTKLDEGVDYYRSLHHFVQYVDHLSFLGSVVEQDNIIVAHEVLTFHIHVVELTQRYKLPFHVLPSSTLIYRCLLTSPVLASRVCELMLLIRPVLERLQEELADTDVIIDFNTGGERSNLNVYNSYVTEIVYAMYKGQPLAGKKNASLILYHMKDVKETLAFKRHSQFKTALSIFEGVFFSGFARRFMDENGIDVARDIRRHHSGDYLRFLEGCGFKGVAEFMRVFISKLQEKQQQEQQQ